MPIGLLCLAWGAWALPRVARSGERQGIDLPGNLLVLVALFGLLLVSGMTVREIIDRLKFYFGVDLKEQYGDEEPLDDEDLDSPFAAFDSGRGGS